MKIYKEGIVKTIKETEWQHYREMGFVKVPEEAKTTLHNDEPTLDDLKKIADELGVDYGTNIGYQTLLQRINAKKEAQ